VLVLAPDGNLAAAIRNALFEAAPAAQVDIAHSLQEAQHVVVHQRPDLFVLDVDATYDLGQEFLYDLRTSHPNARAIVLTGVHLAAHRERAAGLGAIHFLEKPFPHDDFVTLVGALLQAGGDEGGEKFQGKLSDLHIADIIQLKCMSGATSALEFTGPKGGKARVYFEQGQVVHASAPGKQGVEAFNEIVNWKGGTISEVSGAGQSPRTIDLDWQILLMEAVRKQDETAAASPTPTAPAAKPASRKILVVDDSLMLLSFVKEILAEANYDVTSAATAQEGLAAATSSPPDLILLDYVLPDMKGDEFIRQLVNDERTANSRVVYMSGFGTDLPADQHQGANVIGSLHKPFTSDILLKTVAMYLPDEPATQPATSQPVESGWAPADNPDSEATSTQDIAPSGDVQTIEAAAGGGSEPWWSAPPPPAAPWQEMQTPPAPTQSFDAPAPLGEFGASQDQFAPLQPMAANPPLVDLPAETGGAYFSGDTSFFSLNWALHTIAAQKLTGSFRAFWSQSPVELLARDGAIILATTRDPELYCPESPITLVNVDEWRVQAARDQQRETGRPFFTTLAQEGLILREPALQLVQHYGQKLFAQLWTAPRVRILFEQHQNLPDYAAEIPPEEDVDHWALGTLRFIQFHELGNKADYDPASVPAYTRDGFERVQRLRLTVAEAQFASQFNGVRSIAQIAKNLRLDLKFARLTLFRFLALEIVECWPPNAVAPKPEKRGVFGRMFGE
jgi:twitching motility two-component system response regulator PilH